MTTFPNRFAFQPKDYLILVLKHTPPAFLTSMIWLKTSMTAFLHSFLPFFLLLFVLMGEHKVHYQGKCKILQRFSKNLFQQQKKFKLI